MSSILINTDELERLAGQPPELWQFYIVVKKYMDYQTGVVGKSWGVSWHTIQMQMHVDPRPGLKGTGTPSVHQVRSLAERAERLGLLNTRSEERRLVFFLPIAKILQPVDSVTEADFFAQNKVGSISTVSRHEEVGSSECSNDAASGAKTAKSRQTKNRANSAEVGSIQVSSIKDKECLTTLSETADALSAKRRPVDVQPATDHLPAVPTKPTAVQTVFKYWQLTMDKPTAKLDAKRTKAIAGRLKDGYTVSDLCHAIDGCKASAWHMGKNDRNRAFNDVELICRDSARVDAFRERMETSKAVDQELQDWINDDVGKFKNTFEGEFHHVSSGECYAGF